MPKIEVYQVDTSVPIPDEDKRIPLSALGIGESFLFPLTRRKSLQSMATRLKRLEGKEFTIKKQDDNNARIWRIK